MLVLLYRFNEHVYKITSDDNYFLLPWQFTDADEFVKFNSETGEIISEKNYLRLIARVCWQWQLQEIKKLWEIQRQNRKDYTIRLACPDDLPRAENENITKLVL